MSILFVFFVATLLATTCSRITHQQVNPYDIEEEVKVQLASLNSTVRGAIYAGFNSINDLVRDVYLFRDGLLSSTQIAIQQEYQTLNSQITTLKDLALAAGQNVDICLNINEPLLNQLPQEIIESLIDCIAFANRELTLIMNDSKYRIDTYMNEVNIFHFQLELCASDFLCMSPLITKIELAIIGIPQKIGIEVEQAIALGEDLKVLIKECTDAKVAQCSAEGGIIVSEITNCVNNILS